MPAYGALNSSFTINGAVHDPLTGLDTGSGNDRFNQYVTGDGSDQLQLDTGSGNDRLIGIDTGSGNDHIVHHVSGASGPGGTTFFTENISGTAGPGGTSFFTENISSTSGPGGTTFMTGVDHLGQFGHEADHFTNFAMPVGDFI